MTLRGILSILIALVMQAGSLQGALTATANITWTIGSIDAISISGNPGAFNITTAVAGSAPTSATDATTTYAVTTNNTARKITGMLGSALPSGVTLSVSLAAPAGATSAGTVNLTTAAASLVTGIATIASSGLSITYTFAATVSAAQATSQSNSVIYTIGP